MYGKCTNVFHDVKCVNGTSGIMTCDVYALEEAPNKKTMDGVLTKAHRAWQAKLASVTEFTKDFNETSKKILGDVLCDVRYVYRTNPV